MSSFALLNKTGNVAVCRMKKGPAYHWDLMVVAILNAVLAYFGLPMVHGALPHSPLHVRAMADVEDRVSQGHVYLKLANNATVAYWPRNFNIANRKHNFAELK